MRGMLGVWVLTRAATPGYTIAFGLCSPLLCFQREQVPSGFTGHANVVALTLKKFPGRANAEKRNC